MLAQAALLQKSGIPEGDFAEYAQSSLADGKRLRLYTERMLRGKIAPHKAAQKLRIDYMKWRGQL